MIHDLFTTAFEGRFYWGTVDSYRWSTDGGTTPDLRGFQAVITDDDGDTYTVDRTTILRGLRLAYEHRAAYTPYIRKALTDLTFGNFDEVDFDADVADIVLQFGVLGEVIYG